MVVEMPSQIGSGLEWDAGEVITMWYGSLSTISGPTATLKEAFQVLALKSLSDTPSK